MAHGKQDKVRIIVAFGDIEGFTSFLDAVTNEAVELDPFMDQFDQIIDRAERETGFAFRDTGDGFMCLVDLDEKQIVNTALQLLASLQRVLIAMRELRENMSSVRWKDFRIVVASGYVKRKVRRNGKVCLRGRHINLAHNLLDIARGQGIVCHESFRALIPDETARANGFQFRNLPWPRKLPDSVPRKDANSLFVIEKLVRRR